MKKTFFSARQATIQTLALCTCLSLIAGCHSSSSDNKVPETGKGVPADQNNYRLNLVSLVAGSYSGDCVKFPEGTVTREAVVITPVGDASAGGAAGSISAAKVNMLFDRKFVNDSVDSASFKATDISSDKGLDLSIESGATDTSQIASIRQGVGNAPGVKCTHAANAAELKTKSGLSVVGKYLISAKRTVSCLLADSVKQLDYEVTADTAKIGEETFSLTTHLAEEIVNVLPTENLLTYSIKTTDDRSLSVTLDGKGKLKVINIKDKTGTEFGCVP